MSIKHFAAALAVSLLASPVLAADFGSYDQPSSGSWEGAYAGVHGGMASPNLNPFSGNKGLSVGGQAGYNTMVGGAVVGGEVEASYLGDSRVKVEDGKLKERHRLSAKGKVGAPIDQTLIYGTAGFAMTNFRDNGNIAGPDGWKPGYILGAGVEQKLTSNVSARVEYNYTITNSVRTFSNGVGTTGNVHDHTLKAGLNVSF
ncbi:MULTISPECIES: outer membrane protein [unclassified Rhizobium]|uniref:outer membrane protein n=1 Tax=unclassified Rhizobium TaxID=2613769 RepID=UPI000DBA5595|nr:MULTISPECIES: outer membrane beta-barrel protein [unclassified Rhizobium]MBO9126790.1 porin family protein [Rhizobium sp. 16-488-2b]MBO9177237.1 porin family protein [Rhizobium sp. 16-488-2a]